MSLVKNILLFITLWLLSLTAMAEKFLNDQASSHSLNAIFAQQPEFLPAEEAFPLDVTINEAKDEITLKWNTAEGYYLYRKSFGFSIQDETKATLGQAIIPKGVPITDEHYGEVEVYFGQLTVQIPVTVANSDQGFEFIVKFQGCAEAGLCYPPETKKYNFNAQQTHTVSESTTAPNATNNAPPYTQPPSESEDWITRLLAKDPGFFLTILSFFAIGVALTFTPCVLPMIPILSGIIVGQHEKPSTARAFSLSLTYILGIAITYGVIGFLIGFFGKEVQISQYLQTTWIIIPFAAIFVALALSMFGFYEIRLPKKLHDKIHHANHQQKGGTYIGVAIMGILSSLIVSPCTSAPLLGAITFLAGKSDAFLGASALFSLGLGMGVPLMIIGTSEGKLLPKVGTWMDRTKDIFGVLLLGVAIWLLERVLPGPATLALWATLSLTCGVFMGGLDLNPKQGIQRLWQALGFILIVYGVLLLIGATSGQSNPLQPLAGMQTSNVQQTKTELFRPIENVNDLENAFKEQQNGRIFMLDVYADWCVYCKKLENSIFPSPEISPLLGEMNLLKLDVTDWAQYKDIREQLGIDATPMLLFYKSNGEEIIDYQVKGNISKENLQNHLKSLLNLSKIDENP